MRPRHSRQIDNVSENLVSENLSARRIRESRQKRAKQGFVQLEPAPRARSRESERVYTRRLNRVSLIEDASKKRRLRSTIIIAILVIAALIVASFVAVQVFMRTTDSKLAIDDSNLSSVLVSASDEEARYILCLADLKNPSFSYFSDQDDAVMLVRADEATKSVGFFSIPANMYIKDGNDEKVKILDMMREGDYSHLVQAISLFVGTNINHLVTTDFKRLESLVYVVGGVDVDVPQEIDDPAVGSIVIRAGENSLNGQTALEFVRATNLFGGFTATAKDRAMFTEALLSKALDSNQVEFVTLVSDASNYIDTDWKTSDIMAFADTFKPYDSITFYDSSYSWSENTSEGEGTVYSYDPSEFEEFMAIFKQGENPSASDEAELNGIESKIIIEVRNGAGIDGAAATLGAILENNGYTVKGVGNTNDDTLYPETLVVYTGTGSEEKANAVIRDIGAGRAVEGGDFYKSKADVIVIIGTDWSKS